MEKLLANYLFQHKICPLPTIGMLVLRAGHAQAIAGEKKILAPIPFVELSQKETSSYELTDFIARKQHIPLSQAQTMLTHYCEVVKQLPAYGEIGMGSAGSFYMDENDVLHFKSAAMPAAFYPEVLAERVIHVDASHNMLVGDTETNTTAMSELLNEAAAVKSKWWIAALVLALIGFALIFYYYSRHPEGGFGNEAGFSTSTTPSIYSTQ